MSRKVCGVGINDADYAIGGKDRVTGESWKCPYYDRWVGMLRRCYSEKLQEKYPTYKGCSVCDEWLTFSNFKRWMEKQDWEGKHLDKDFIVECNKVYSPDTCVFMDGRLNTFINTYNNGRGEYSLGVHFSKSKGKYESMCRDGLGGRVYLGIFEDPLEAHKAWQKAKLEVGYRLLTEQTDERVTSALQRILTKLQHERDNNMETLSL